MRVRLSESSPRFIQGNQETINEFYKRKQLVSGVADVVGARTTPTGPLTEALNGLLRGYQEINFVLFADESKMGSQSYWIPKGPRVSFTLLPLVTLSKENVAE